MNYQDHPLLKLSSQKHHSQQPLSDQTPDHIQSRIKVGLKQRLKNRIGFYLYPLRNKIFAKSNFKILGDTPGFQNADTLPDIIGFGHKGFGQEIFLNAIKSKMTDRPKVVLCYGCGMGDETINIAKYLRPNKIIGTDYFNYGKYWTFVSRELKEVYDIESEFCQLNLDSPRTDFLNSVDLIYSHAVLEHLRDMEAIFSILRQFLKPKGYFAAQWGPMWYSYSGDHISGELGIENGFEHLHLSSEAYLDFYKNHPRNREDVRCGRPTWLELGLHNFATYNQYIITLERNFGSIHYLQWVLSSEAFKYKTRFKKKWDGILGKHDHISELDMVLQCAGVLLN